MNKNTSPAFVKWWIDEGSEALEPKSGKPKIRARRVAEIAWSNGAYKATEETRALLEEIVKCYAGGCEGLLELMMRAERLLGPTKN